jgi:hypothetical protein
VLLERTSQKDVVEASKVKEGGRKKEEKLCHLKTTFGRGESNPGLPVCTLEYTQCTIPGGVLYTMSDFWE